MMNDPVLASGADNFEPIEMEGFDCCLGGQI